MTAKRQYKTYTKEFKEEAVKLVLEQSYDVVKQIQTPQLSN